MKRFSKCTKKVLSVFLSVVMVVAIFTVAPISASAATYNFLFPVQNGEISYYFGYSSSYGGDHNGIDIRPHGNDTIYAASDGVVVKAVNSCNHINSVGCNCYPTYGNYIKIKNNDGTYACYGHLLKNSLRVSVGDNVVRGQAIATMGSSGNSSAKHLHFDVKLSNGSTLVNVNPTTKGGSVVYSYSGYGDDELVVFDTNNVSGIENNNATISTWVSNTGSITEVGFYIGTTPNYLEKITTNNSTVQWTRFNLNYSLNEYYGILSPGQIYYYQFYVVSNGEMFKSNLDSFTTLGAGEISFDTYSLDSVEDVNAKINVWFSNPKAITLSSVGFCYGIDRTNLIHKQISSNINWTRANLVYDIKNYIGMLNPNTRYYTRFYIVANGITYYSDYINFTTTSKVTFDTYSINNTTTYNTMSGVWLNNPNGHILDSVGFYIGTDINCSEKVETVSNVQWTRPHLQYVIREYYSKLKPNTNYYLKYYVTIDEVTYFSDIMNFHTENDITFDSNAVIENITETSANIKLWMSNTEGNPISSLGFLYGLEKENMDKVEVNKDVGWTRANLDYTISEFGIMLKPNTKYYYRFYGVVGNNTYYSDYYSFTTKECLEHDYSVNVVEALPNQAGYTEYVCKICGHSYREALLLLGDMDNDGSLSKGDMYAWMGIYANQSITPPNEYQLSVGDLNGNGKFDAVDKMMLNRMIS